MVQAAACRVALYGFNSHPQLHNINTIRFLYLFGGEPYIEFA